MGQDPSDIRAEIEETRARVGDEVDALSYKTDVPARVGDYVDDKKQAVKDKVSGVKDAIVGTTSDAVQTTSDALPSGQQLGKLKDTAERNPLGLAVGVRQSASSPDCCSHRPDSRTGRWAKCRTR